MPNDLVSTAWAAKALGVHSATVRRLVDSGDLQPTVKAPGRTGAYLFDQADVIRLATKRAA